MSSLGNTKNEEMGDLWNRMVDKKFNDVTPNLQYLNAFNPLEIFINALILAKFLLKFSEYPHYHTNTMKIKFEGCEN